MIAMFLAEMLEDMGYRVCAIAVTEEDAVAAAARCKPGLMIVDEHLREGSGTSAVARILLSGPDPCVSISGARVKRESQDATVLRKPFQAQDLVRAIRNAVGDFPSRRRSSPSGRCRPASLMARKRPKPSQRSILRPPASVEGESEKSVE